jgi:hypothetical protein
MTDEELQVGIASLSTHDDVRAEVERLREHMTICMERVRRDIHAPIDAIEFMKHLDS